MNNFKVLEYLIPKVIGHQIDIRLFSIQTVPPSQL